MRDRFAPEVFAFVAALDPLQRRVARVTGASIAWDGTAITIEVASVSRVNAISQVLIERQVAAPYPWRVSAPFVR
jgi:hypothetical protein